MLKKLLEKLYFRFCAIKEEGSFTPKAEQAILSEMGKVENAKELMKFYMTRDRNRYFNATDDDSRHMIKGQSLRTGHILGMMKGNIGSKGGVSSGLDNKRYG